ncbi:nuclear transport factor 2 family protein [Tenacibaculum sp. SDUM215027]|uniref:nuclear transport factor 2 family protein n=1 Tax=Tenacibaculum sp. SDUM215027 TaxID=3422596 RepID=UPI003D31BD25
MVKIISSPNCGNSPKMTLLKEFNIAFANGNMEFLTENVTDDIVWSIVGDRKIEGKKEFIEELKKIKEKEVTELTLKQILSHGKEGAVNGTIKMQNGKKHAFSNFYFFKGAKGAKIKLITSYIIEVDLQ